MLFSSLLTPIHNFLSTKNAKLLSKVVNPTKKEINNLIFRAGESKNVMLGAGGEANFKVRNNIYKLCQISRNMV